MNEFVHEKTQTTLHMHGYHDESNRSQAGGP